MPLLPCKSKIKRAYRRLNAVVNKPRVRVILNFIIENPGRTVREIEVQCKIPSQSETSLVLSRLRRHAYVVTVREGKYIRYYPDNESLKQLKRTIEDFFPSYSKQYHINNNSGSKVHTRS